MTDAKYRERIIKHPRDKEYFNLISVKDASGRSYATEIKMLPKERTYQYRYPRTAFRISLLYSKIPKQIAAC
jgi:hypothetical protein